jgi:hypothetical protein
LRVYFALSEKQRHKKGGGNDLKKLRSANGAILTFFLLGEARTAEGGLLSGLKMSLCVIHLKRQKRL